MKVTLKDMSKGPGYVTLFAVKVNGQDVARLVQRGSAVSEWILERSGLVLFKSYDRAKVSEYIHSNEALWLGYAERNAKEQAAFEAKHAETQAIIAAARARARKEA